MNWETLLCLGDSITIGSRSYLAYPEYCGNYLAEQTNKSWNVINHATAGFTTIDLVRSIDKNLAHLKSCKPEIISILIGTNDLKSNTPVSDFKIAYEQLAIKARLLVGNSNVILLEIPKLMDGVMLPYKIGMNEQVVHYNNIIRGIGEEQNLMIGTLDPEPGYFYDGVHLNAKGSNSWGLQLANLIVKLRKS